MSTYSTRPRRKGIPVVDLRGKHKSLWNHDVPFREQRNSGLALRTYRAIDWLYRAQLEQTDDFAAFLFSWIGFNALFGAEPHVDDAGAYQRARRAYFGELVRIDSRHLVHKSLRVVQTEALRLLENELAYKLSDSGSGSRRSGHRRRLADDFLKDLELGQTADALDLVFVRLNCIRNWLVHGGIAWQSRVMAATVADCCAMLGLLLPTFVGVMLAESEGHPWSMPPLTPDQYEERTSPKEIPIVETTSFAGDFNLRRAIQERP